MQVIQIAVGIFLITTTLFALFGIARSHDVWYILTYGIGFGTFFGLTSLIVGILTYKPKKKQAFDMESAEEYEQKKQARKKEQFEKRLKGAGKKGADSPKPTE